MKKIKTKHQDSTDFEKMMEEMEQFDVFVDWKESPAAVLDSVDEQLKKFGLEVVMPDTCAQDGYYFSIRRKARR